MKKKSLSMNWPWVVDKIINDKLDTIINMLISVQGKEKIIMADLTALTAQVEENTSAEQSAVTLLNGLSELLKQAGTDPVALKSLQEQLKTSADALAAAVVANTPSE